MTPTQQKMVSLRHHTNIGESGGLQTLGCYAGDEMIWRIKGIPHVTHCWGAEPMKHISKHGWPRGWRLDVNCDETLIVRPDKLKVTPVGIL